MTRPPKSLSVRSHQKSSVAFPALFAILISLVVYADGRLTNAGAEKSHGDAVSTGSQQNPAAGCCGGDEGDNKPHLLAGSYYSLNNGFSAKLLLNNKGPIPIEVHPTLFSLSGERFNVPPVTVDATSHRFEDFDEWVAVAGAQFREGSIQVFHRGKDLVLGTQIYLTDELHSLSFEEKLTELELPGSARLEGVWWLPSPKGDVHLVLSNTSDIPLSVSTTIRGETPKREASKNVNTTFYLAPHETKILDVERDLLGEDESAMSSFGAISLEHNGGQRALLARAMALDASRGYSLPVQFVDPGSAKSSNLQGAGLRIGKVGTEFLSPKVVVHNAGGIETVLSGRVPFTTAEGTSGEIVLPEVHLSPGETQVIDVERHVKANGVDNVASAGLEFQHTGELGSVITSAFSVSRSGNQVFRVPLWDIAAQRSATGGYPWYIDGNSSTVVYIKNVTDEPRQYRMYLKLTEGNYVFPLKTVAPHQTTTIDVRELRDNQVADVNGDTIPLDETGGQVQWSMTGAEDKVLIGRAEQVNLVQGVSSNYACQNCCSNSFYDAWITPEATGFEGDQIWLFAMQQDANCYGQTFPEYQAGFVQFNSGAPSICNFGLNGQVTGIGPGLGGIQAHWTADSWLRGGNDQCEYTPVNVLRDAICEIFARRVDSVTPERALIGHPVDVVINGSGFGTGLPTVEAGNGITVSNVELINNSEVRARFTIASSAPPGNHAVSVTTSSGLTTTVLGKFFVQVPASLRRDSLSEIIEIANGSVVDGLGQTRGTNKCGGYRNVVYQLMDQDDPAQPLLAALELDERFSNYQGPPSLNPGSAKFGATNSNGKTADVLGVVDAYPSCPAPVTVSFNQRFQVVIGTQIYNLTTTNSVAIEFDGQEWFITVSMTHP